MLFDIGQTLKWKIQGYQIQYCKNSIILRFLLVQTLDRNCYFEVFTIELKTIFNLVCLLDLMFPDCNTTIPWCLQSAKDRWYLVSCSLYWIEDNFQPPLRSDYEVSCSKKVDGRQLWFSLALENDGQQMQAFNN